VIIGQRHTVDRRRRSSQVDEVPGGVYLDRSRVTYDLHPAIAVALRAVLMNEHDR
jgi:hypothetical protein